MGGDDLGSDDEYLQSKVTDDVKNSNKRLLLLEGSGGAKKRRSRSSAVSDDEEDEENANVENDDDDDNDNDNDDDTNGQTAATTKPFHKVFLEASRHLEQESTETQAAYLTAALAQYPPSNNDNDDNNNNKDNDNNCKPIRILPRYFRKCSLQSSQLSSSSTSSSSSSEFFQRLSQAMSLKRLKTSLLSSSSSIGSPTVLIVCLSARRAVDLLKQIAGWKLPVAKLFAKHISLQQQKELLSSRPFGVAIGTPHRILALCRRHGSNVNNNNNNNNNNTAEEKSNTRIGPARTAPAPALHFSATQLVVLDAHVNVKGYTVCSLPDTAKDCMELLRDHVIPMLPVRKDLKLAFF